MKSRFPARAHATPFLLAALWLGIPKGARAEDKLGYKYQLYQEDSDRIRIEVNSAFIEADLDKIGKMHLKLHGVLDAISGATPDGEPAPTSDGQVPLSHVHDRRKAWDAEFRYKAGTPTYSLGFANSRESDYVSNALTLNTSIDLNHSNTQLLLGASDSHDRLHVFYQNDWASKTSASGLLGMSHIIDPRTAITVNFTFTRDIGVLSDPYRIIQKTTEILPGLSLPLTFLENRPSLRDKWTLYTRINRSLPSLHSSLDASARYYQDNWGVKAGTAEASWIQKLGTHFALTPRFRYYVQSAADFYHVSLDGTTITPTDIPQRAGPFYSSDYRVSKLNTYLGSLKLTWFATDSLSFDVEYARYAMEGRDGRTSASAYPKANIVTVGGQWLW